MLKFFIDIIGFLAIFSFLFGINFSILNKSENKNLITKIFIGLISFVGFIATVILTVLRKLYPQKMVKYTLFYNRWALALAMIFMFISFLILLIFFIIDFNKKEKLKRVFLFLYESISFIAIWFLGFTIFPQVYALSKEFVAFGENSFGTQSLIRTGGYILGILLIILIGLSLYKVSSRLKGIKFKIFSLFIIGISFIDYMLRGVSALARLHILKSRNTIVFNFMIWEDKSLPYILLFFTIVVIIFSLKLYIDSFKINGYFKNNAMLRIEKAKMIKNKRWSISLVFFVVVALFSITIIHKQITKPVELSPPEDYQMEGNFINIPLSTVDDGHLHRFSYISDDHNIRFIVVKKPKGGSYGVGLDACDICGIAGYFERNDEVVCKRCDVVMNKSTIGFKGGCNPVPFEYEIKNSKIIINKVVLENEKDRFPVGE